MRPTAEELKNMGVPAECICRPGWTPSAENIVETAQVLADLMPGKNDTVVFDLLSNSAFMGSDDEGMPTPVYKGGDGIHHVPGGLQAAPKGVLQKIAREAQELVGAAAGARVVHVVPFPRYFNGKCCDEADHVTNYGTGDLLEEYNRVIDNATAAIANCSDGQPYRCISVFDIFGTDTDLSSMVTSTGETIWGSDPVHLSVEAYREVARAVLGGEDNEPRCKRDRLDSVVPGPPPKKFRGQQVKPSPWVAGSSEPGPRGRAPGRGGYSGYGYGRGRGGVTYPAAGTVFGGVSRPRGWRGSRVPLRGPVRGRGWGRGRGY